jgi:hypothetical protein
MFVLFVGLAAWVLACDDGRANGGTTGGGGTGGTTGGNTGGTTGGTTGGSTEGGETGTDSDATAGDDGFVFDNDAEPTGPENPTPGCYKNDTPNAIEGGGLEDAPYPGALLPGEPCVDHEDCMYGLCESNSPITQGKFKICVKRCQGCGPKSPACSWDDDPSASALYTAVIGKDMEGNNVCHCARNCSSSSGFAGVENCKTLSDDYTTCNSEHSGQNYCGAWD